MRRGSDLPTYSSNFACYARKLKPRQINAAPLQTKTRAHTRTHNTHTHTFTLICKHSKNGNSLRELPTTTCCESQPFGLSTTQIEPQHVGCRTMTYTRASSWLPANATPHHPPSSYSLNATHSHPITHTLSATLFERKRQRTYIGGIFCSKKFFAQVSQTTLFCSHATANVAAAPLRSGQSYSYNTYQSIDVKARRVRVIIQIVYPQLNFVSEKIKRIYKISIFGTRCNRIIIIITTATNWS